ncbi:unnamed protein product [Rotaria socialis]|uniref:Uncharacterized protein n=1 Tax=Rotaria socialis TaxID=392032 RepID=A0A817LHJ1_9BILA|nr:unnamed protein product [Rotaria socialis]CAF3388409.1 unnamed protein product [Rotaria socialis]CAF3423183.1 unnamed protein product [Rotaria socialis]CAF4353636.1 unnamed protein product [Rotaria socialis]CAF4360647.1 unnamed protein product [Rotaria socialis]
MGQSQSAKFDKMFTLICTNNATELERQIRSCSSAEQKANLSNLSDTNQGVTLLMYAAFYGNKNVCHLLIEAGAEVFSRDHEGRNVLYYAITSQSFHVVKYLLENVITEVDSDARQNFINNRDSMGETCLHEAVKIHAVSCIDLVLKADIDVNIVNNDGITALHRAVDLGHQDIVRLLLKYKVELNTKDASGWTPLHVASAHNDLELVRLLVNRGANLNATDSQGHSPLKWARESGSRDVFTYLKAQGAKEFDSSQPQPPQRSSKKKNNVPSTQDIANN